MINATLNSNDTTMLETLASETGRSTEDLMSMAIRELKRLFVTEKTISGYREMKKDDHAWQIEIAERNDWEQAQLANDLRHLNAVIPSHRVIHHTLIRMLFAERRVRIAAQKLRIPSPGTCRPSAHRGEL